MQSTTSVSKTIPENFERAKEKEGTRPRKGEADDGDGDDKRRSLLLCKCMYLIAVSLYKLDRVARGVLKEG